MLRSEKLTRELCVLVIIVSAFLCFYSYPSGLAPNYIKSMFFPHFYYVYTVRELRVTRKAGTR